MVLFMSVVTATAFSQEAPATPKHRAFIYAGTNWAPGYQLSYSAEVGTWGMSSNASFSATYDAVPSGNTITSYVGAKAYYTVHSEQKLCYMVYIAPKVALNSEKTQLVEYGFNPNYTLTNDLLLAVTLGNQAYNASPWNPFVSGGIIYLFRKN